MGADELPAPARRQLRIVGYITAALMLGGILASSVAHIVGLQTGRWLLKGWMVWLCVGVFPLWMFVAPHLALRSFLRKLREAQYLICLTCGQNLTGLPEDHKCPECGTAFNAATLADRWTAWLRTINRKPE